MSYLAHVDWTALCPHAGQVQIQPGNARVKLSGHPAATVGDQFMISGCPFTLPPSTPSPCLTVQWLVPASRVKIGGQAAVLSTSTGLCKAGTQAPQGAPQVSVTQQKVKGQ